MKILLNIKFAFISSLALLVSFSSLAQEESSYPKGVHIDSDGNVSRALIDLETSVGGTSIRYSSYGASGMFANYNDPRVYSGGGCMTPILDSGLLDLQAAVDLPQGARIVSVSFLFQDNDATANGQGRLFEFLEDGTQDTLVNVGTSDSPGAISIGGFLDYTIQTNLNARLMVSLFTGDTEVEACGVRVGFISPIVASDVIFVHNFSR